MRAPLPSWLRFLARRACLVWLALCSGCGFTNKPLFTVAGPGWSVQEGQALWRPRRQYPELGGELVLASHTNGSCCLDFSKTPMSLVSAQTTRTNWVILFPPRHIGFKGKRQPPTRFLFLHLPAALAGEPLPAPLRFARKPDGSWRLENPSSGETLEGYLSP